MDATQKRRMWKVAISHFALTVFFTWQAMHYGDVFFEPAPPLLQFWWNGIYVLQPLAWITIKMPLDFMQDFLFPSFPIWSICFGWIFVKLDNWLNHFAVLGRKVF